MIFFFLLILPGRFAPGSLHCLLIVIFTIDSQWDSHLDFELTTVEHSPFCIYSLLHSFGLVFGTTVLQKGNIPPLVFTRSPVSENEKCLHSMMLPPPYLHHTVLWNLPKYSFFNFLRILFSWLLYSCPSVRKSLQLQLYWGDVYTENRSC